MNILLLLGICFKSIAADGESLLAYSRDIYLDKMKTKVADLIKNLPSKKIFSVIEKTEGEKDRKIFFIELREAFAVFRSVPETKVDFSEYGNIYSRFNEGQKDLESLLKKLAEFIEKRVKSEDKIGIYFTLNYELVEESLTPDNCEMIKTTKDRITEMLKNTLTKNDCKVQFYNYKLQQYAYDLIINDGVIFKTSEASSSENKPPKWFKSEDNIEVFKDNKNIIIYIFDKIFFSKTEEILDELIPKAQEGKSFKLNDKQEKFVLSFLQYLGGLNIDLIKEDVKKNFGIYKLVLNFIMISKPNYNKLDKESVANQLLKNLQSSDLSVNFSESDNENIKVLVKEDDNNKIVNFVERLIKKVTNKNQNDVKDLELEMIASFLKIVSSNGTLCGELVSQKKNNNMLCIFYKGLTNKMREELFGFIKKWVTDLAIYSHQEDHVNCNDDYESILKVLKATEPSSLNSLETPLPENIFLCLCDEVQKASEYENKSNDVMDGTLEGF